MKNLSTLFCLTVLLICTEGYARNPYNSTPRPHYKSEQSGCNIPIDQFDLDINNVRARLLDAGDMWWDLNTGVYEIPKGSASSPTTAVNAIFAGSIWMSALDQGFNLKMAALLYRQGTTDYFTGPLDNTGNVTIATCNLWDQHFPVFASDIRPCLTAYAASGNTSVPASVVSGTDSNMMRWPGKGNPYLAAEGYDVSGVLAPFYDANGDGIYNPLDGDYPSIKQSGQVPTTQTGTACDYLQYKTCTTYADEMVFWVMNDEGNAHTASNGAAMGVQINALAFAFQDTNEINDMTFYTYHVINKSGSVLNRTYFSQWTDVDLGCANNDRVGCDTSRNLAIQYNGYVSGAPQIGGVTIDQGSVCPAQEQGYGANLPMLGIQMLESAVDTAIDPATLQPRKLGMTSFCYFTNGGATGQSDPSSASGFRNYQSGFWNDGTPMTYGGAGYGSGRISPYSFPGDPSIASQWSECNTQSGPAIQAGDRRFVQTSGPFTFLPCASQDFTLAVLFAQPPGGVGSNCPSWSIIDAVADKASALFNGCFAHQAVVPSSIADIEAGGVNAYPNPVSDFLYLTTSGSKPIEQVCVYDLMGRVVLSQNMSSSSIDMSKLTEGVYFLKTSGNNDQAIKIVKR